MFAVPRIRTALNCSKRVKVSTPFRPLSITLPRLSENDLPPDTKATEPKAAETPSNSGGAIPRTNQTVSDTSEPLSSVADSAAAGGESSSDATSSTVDEMNMNESKDGSLDADAGQIPEEPARPPKPDLSWQLPIRPKTKPLETAKPWHERMEALSEGGRLPRSIQAAYLQPLKRKPEYGIPVCDLQLRSYHVRHVEFFADFALRAAYYLNLPASGPVPLPRITERWTVIKSPFIFKKVQENYERVTLRRLIQIKDGHSDVVQTWLAFLRKHAFHGVGMKANVYEQAPLDFVDKVDESAKNMEKLLETELGLFGSRKDAKHKDSISRLIETDKDSNRGMPLTEVRKM